MSRIVRFLFECMVLITAVLVATWPVWIAVWMAGYIFGRLFT